MIRFRLGELFCGPGGLGLGAKMASNGCIKHMWATDYDKDSCATYKENVKPRKIFCKDIKKLDLSKLEPVDMLAFGFPCNDFSRVGEQKGIKGLFGCLYKHCLNAVDFFEPKVWVAENVSGLKNSNEGKAFEQILLEFQQLGYNLYPNLYKFEDYGIPQKRHRIIIVGIREDVNVVYEKPSTKPYRKIDNSAKKALSKISKNVENNKKTKQSPKVIERLKYIKEGENAFNANIPKHLL
jgi:DNA (cytosine-5)-methyltransferase 1